MQGRAPPTGKEADIDDMANDAAPDWNNDGSYPKAGPYLTDTEERMDKVDARIARIHEFMQDALQQTALRGGELRNRFTVIEDLVRSQRDATGERSAWDQMPS